MRRRSFALRERRRVVIGEWAAVVAASVVAGRRAARHGQVIEARSSVLSHTHQRTTDMKAFALAAALTLISAPAFAQDGSITLTFDVGAETGGVMVALYNSAETYAGGAPARTARIDVPSGDRSVTFDHLLAGDSAMKSFHDVDNDGSMDTNPFGMPTEPYAFSNNAVGNMGPASWERAHFAVDGAVSQSIRIR